VNRDPRDGGGPIAARTKRAMWHASADAAPDLCFCCLEGRFGIRAVAPAAARIADAGRCPGVILRCGLVATPASSDVAALVSTLAATESTATESAAVAAAESALAAGALGAVDFGIGVTQARADFIDFELDNGALLAFLGFVGTALQAAGNNHAGSLGEGLGDVFCCLARRIFLLIALTRPCFQPVVCRGFYSVTRFLLLCNISFTKQDQYHCNTDII
jgi:hypothetical protein